MKNLPQDLLDALENNKQKIKVIASIDWDSNNIYELDEDVINNFMSGKISKKLQGDIGVNVEDKATLTLDNSQGNFSPKNMDGKFAGDVLPEKNVKIEAGLDNENLSENLVDVFSGVIKEIKPNFNQSKAAFKTEDLISKLKTIDCPDKFYYNYRREEIIKEWLDIAGINYTNETIDATFSTINENFSGQKMWKAIQVLANSVWARVFIRDGTFYFSTRLSLDYGGEQDPVYNFTEDKYFKISEKYTSKDLYNKVKVVSKPLNKESMQPIWTGAKEQTSIQEEYISDGTSELQLTYVPEGSNSEQPTKNVPLIENSTSVLNINTNTEYTEENGGITVEHETGLISFTGVTGYPVPTSNNTLRVKYEYDFHYIPAGNERNFIMNLDFYAVNIQNLNLLAETVDGTEEETGVQKEVSFDNPTADVYVTQTIMENQKDVKVRIRNNTSHKLVIYGYINSETNTRNTPVLMGEPFKRNNIYEKARENNDSVGAFGEKNMPEIKNNFIPSEDEVEELAEYLLYLYSTPRSILEIETIPLPQLELMDKVSVTQRERDIDNDFFIVEIEHIFKKDGTWTTKLKLEQATPSDFVFDGERTRIIGDGGGDGEDYSPPNPPRNVRAEILQAIKNISIVGVFWNEPIESFEVHHYNIYRKSEEELNLSFLAQIKKGTNSYVDTSVKYLKTYTYAVTAVNKDGIESEAKATEPLLIEKGDPSGVQWDQIYWGADYIKLTWHPHPDDDYIEYEIRIDDANFGEDY